MFSFEYLSRVATAAVGAFILSTLSVAAAVAPGHSAQTGPVAYASVHNGTQANG